MLKTIRILREICLLVSLSLIIYGVSLYDFRAAYIAAGVLLLTGTILGTLRG